MPCIYKFYKILMVYKPYYIQWQPSLFNISKIIILLSTKVKDRESIN